MPQIPLDPRKERAATRRRNISQAQSGQSQSGPPANVGAIGNAVGEVLQWDGENWISAPVALITTNKPVAVAGAIYQSGDYLYFYTGTAWRKVTG